MTDLPHADVAAYAAGILDPEDRPAFETHLAGCDRCRQELDEYASLADALATRGPAIEPPPGLLALTLLAVERDAAPTKRRTTLMRRWLVPATAGLAVFVGAMFLVRSDDPELEAVASLQQGSQVAQVDIIETGIGRVVEFDTTDLPILPKGEYYELWFVGPGDSRKKPNRISAGTFHPDPAGRSRVTFAAAVDPARYRRMAVTAEPGDGDPSPSSPDVLNGPIKLR